jgi:hypothetical protein
MKHRLLLIISFLAGSLSALKAADKTSHGLLIFGSGGIPVCLVSSAGEIEWEYPATMPQGCLLLANGNVLFSQGAGAVEVTRDKKGPWEFADHARFKTVCQVQIIETPAYPLKGGVLR